MSFQAADPEMHVTCVGPFNLQGGRAKSAEHEKGPTDLLAWDRFVPLSPWFKPLD